MALISTTLLRMSSYFKSSCIIEWFSTPMLCQSPLFKVIYREAKLMSNFKIFFV